MENKKWVGDFLNTIDGAFILISDNPVLYGFRRRNVRGYVIK